MDKSHEQAQETRRRNEAKRAELWAEQAAAIRAARTALTRVMESPNATSEQILRAAELLAEIGKH